MDVSHPAPGRFDGCVACALNIAHPCALGSCFILGCRDVRMAAKPVYLGDGSAHPACEPHWNAVVQVLGAQVVFEWMEPSQRIDRVGHVNEQGVEDCG